MAYQENITATIAINAAISGVCFFNSRVLSEIQTPAVWTAADLAFQTSPDGITYTDLYDDAGVPYVAKAGAARSISIDGAMFKSAQYVKVKSVSTADSSASVNQTAERSLVLVGRRYSPVNA